MQSSIWTALLVFALVINVDFCATTEYTVHIGTQATTVGNEYDNPKGRLFAGIPYAQSMAGTNRFMVCLLLRLYNFRRQTLKIHCIKIYLGTQTRIIQIHTPDYKALEMNRSATVLNFGNSQF